MSPFLLSRKYIRIEINNKQIVKTKFCQMNGRPQIKREKPSNKTFKKQRTINII